MCIVLVYLKRGLVCVEKEGLEEVVRCEWEEREGWYKSGRGEIRRGKMSGNESVRA